MDLRLLILKGTSHSGGGDSFSPSEPLLNSCIKPLLRNFANGDANGRPSSNFPPGTKKKKKAKSIHSYHRFLRASESILLKPYVTHTSLFLWRSCFGDVGGSRADDGFGECLALLIFQWSDIGKFQRTRTDKNEG